jgi:hypothetical protein
MSGFPGQGSYGMQLLCRPGRMLTGKHLSYSPGSVASQVPATLLLPCRPLAGAGVGVPAAAGAGRGAGGGVAQILGPRSVFRYLL